MLKSDIKVLRFVKIKYLPGFKVDSHIHDFYHVFYILSGRGNLIIGTNEYEVNEDELYIVPIGIEHAISAKKDIGFQTLEIKFSIQNKKVENLFLTLPNQLKEIYQEINQIFKDLAQEVYKKEIYHEEIISVKFLEAILYLLRGNETRDREQPELNRALYEMDS